MRMQTSVVFPLTLFCKLTELAMMGSDVGSQNAGHHLVGAGRLGELKALLASPGWLERKLHSYGTASVVADFRRHLMVPAAEPHACLWQRMAAHLLIVALHLLVLSLAAT